MVHAQGARIRVAGLQPAQVLAGLTAIAFLVVGIVGLSKTGFGGFTSHHTQWFWMFAGNPLMSVVRIVTGVVGLLLAFGSGGSRTFGWLLFLAYGAMFVWGLMIAGLISANPVAGAGNPMDFTRADNWLHLGVAALGLLIAVLPARHKIALPEEDAADVVEAPTVAETRTDDRLEERTEKRSPAITREERPPGLAH